MTKKITTTIDLLRHAQCEGGEIFRGTTDVKLTETGWRNMRQVADEQVNRKKWQHIISSPLLRCRLFSEELNSKYDIPLSFEKEFREMNYGDWEGKDFKSIWKTEKDKVESIFTDPDIFHPPNGEHMKVFEERVTNALDIVLQKHRGEHVLLVQHGGTIRIALTHLLSLPLAAMVRFHVPYASFSRIEIQQEDSHSQAHLIFHNYEQNGRD